MNYPISHSTDDNKQHRGQTDCHHDQYTSCPVPFVIAICNPAYCLLLKSTTCPSSITRIRSATCAFSSSWVIITIVCPYFFVVSGILYDRDEYTIEASYVAFGSKEFYDEHVAENDRQYNIYFTLNDSANVSMNNIDSVIKQIARIKTPHTAIVS